MFQLIFQNQKFKTLKDFELVKEDFPQFAKVAIEFCRAWLEGQELFTQQTSGSTGAPKQIKVHRNQMIASAQATGAFFEIHSGLKLLCCLNPELIAGKMMLVRAMVWDCEIQLVEPSSNPLNDLEERISLDFVAMVPIQVQNSIQNPESLKKLLNIKHLIIGGAPIGEKLKNELSKLNLNSYQTYGMTETVSHIALAKISAGTLIYQTLPGVEIGQDQRVALWVKSPMSGAELIQTNDLVEFISPNSFVWLGRADFVINSGGIKIHPEVIESRIQATVESYFPDSAFFLFGKKDEILGEKLTLMIENEKADSEKAKLLLYQLRAELSRFESPKDVVFLPSFLRTNSGKIKRKETIQNS